MTYPVIAPFKAGMLRVADDNEIYWETSGNPAGKPLLYLHGGPGSGLGGGDYRRRADPARHLIVGFDQRGCGRSRPLATDALDKLPRNNTEAMIDEIEALREHLHIDTWLVTGGSWGSTLAIAYAQAHPDRVTGIVLVAVTSGSRDEINWITEGVGRIFPEAWERFDAASRRRPGERIIEAYARRLAAADDQDRADAADAWDEWESVHVSLDPGHQPGPRHTDPTQRTVFATLVTHYWAHDCFLTGPGEIQRRMDRIAHIPAVLIHGRRDISGPVATAWRLHKLWPASRLVVIEHEGHGGVDSMNEMCRATDTLADADE